MPSALPGARRLAGSLAAPLPAALLLSALALAALLAGAGAARAGAVPEEAVVATIPFERTAEPNRIVVDLASEGRRFPLMLDTGANFSVLTPLVARELGVSIRRHENRPYRRKTRLGRDLEFLIDTRSSDTRSKTGWEYGVLGGNLLQEYVFELDFPMRIVRFLDPERFTVPEQPAGSEEAVVPITLSATRPTVDVEIDGRRAPLLLTTGSAWPLILSGAAARSLGVDPDALPVIGETVNALGPAELRFHEVGRLAIGGLEMGPVAAIVAPHGLYNLGNTTDSLLGYDLLSRYLVRIDYPRKRLWLRRESSEVPFQGVAYAPMHEMGVLLQQDATGELQVTAVRPGGIAERRGVRRGDQVLATGRTGGGGRCARRSLPCATAAFCGWCAGEDGIPNEVPLAPLAAAETTETRVSVP